MKRERSEIQAHVLPKRKKCTFAFIPVTVEKSPVQVVEDIKCGNKTNIEARLAEILDKAFRGEISSNEYLDLYNMLKMVKKSIPPDAIGITADSLVGFITNNPTVAILLFEYILHSSRISDEHLTAFLQPHVDTSNAINVITRLLSATNLPLDFLQAFVAKCVTLTMPPDAMLAQVIGFLIRLFDENILSLPKCSELFGMIKQFLNTCVHLEGTQKLTVHIQHLEQTYVAMMML